MRRFTICAALAAVCALAAAGCGSSDGGETAATGTTSGIDAPAQKAIDAAYGGYFAEPPATSPTPKKGANIWFVLLSAQLQDWKEPGQIYDGAKALGWRLTLFDGKFSSDTVVTGLRQAIADKADGIIMMVVDCAPVKTALEDVDRAGIPVVAIESLDCSETTPGAPSLFDAQAAFHNPKDPSTPLGYADYIKNQFGYGQGLSAIAGTQGKAKIIDIKETDLQGTVQADLGVREALKDHCPACEIVDTIEIVGNDLGATLQQRVSQALVQHPEANAVISPYDAPALNAAAAVVASGRKDKIWHVAGEGTPEMVSLLRRGQGINAGVGSSIQWESWSAMDALNRLLAGEKPAASGGFQTGNSTQIFTKEKNMPTGKRWTPPVDFHAAYRKAWSGE